MSRGRGKVETVLLSELLALELSKAPQSDKERGLPTSDLAARVFSPDTADLVSKTGGKVVITEPQRISVSRALNRLAAEGMVRKVKKFKAPYGETLWQIHPRVVIR